MDCGFLDAMLFLRILAAWFLLIGVESIHGVLRTIFVVPWAGDFRSRQISVFTGSALILLVTYFSIGWIRARSTRELLIVGVVWLVLTVAFELVFGHYVFGRSWANLGEDYHLMRGGLLPLGLAVLTLAPLLAARMRGFRLY